MDGNPGKDFRRDRSMCEIALQKDVLVDYRERVRHWDTVPKIAVVLHCLGQAGDKSQDGIV
jgi:hypothetical protein